MERRQYKRLPAGSQVTIRAVSAEGLGRAVARNISGGGILISSENRYQPGSLLDIEVITATHRAFTHVFPPLQARVRVVRVEGERAPYDIAAEFIEVVR